MNHLRRASSLALLACLVACNDQASNPGHDAGVDVDAMVDGSGDVADTTDEMGAIDVPIVACDKEDDLSPNHGPEEAVVVSAGTLEVEGLYVCSDTDDWFEVDVRAGQTISAQIEFADRIGDLDLYLLPAGTEDLDAAVAVSGTREDIESLSFEAPDAGTWYVVVDSFEGAVGVYDLSIAVSCRGDEDCAEGYSCSFVERQCLEDMEPLCGDDANEPNDSAAAATSVVFGSDGFAFLHGLKVCDVDDDYFAVTFDEPSTLSGELEFNPDVDLDLYVFAEDGEVVASAVSQADSPEVVALPMLAPGTYIVAVDYYVTDLGGNVDYNLTLSLTADACASNLDCNAEGRGLCADGACIGFVADEPGDAGALCDDDGDCSGDLQCYESGPGLDDNFCTVGCADDGECSMFDDGYCLRFGRSGVCFDSCASDADCPTYFSCGGAGRCVLIDCRVDADCEEGSLCRRTEQQNSGFCTSAEFRGCTTDDLLEDNDTDGSSAEIDLDGVDAAIICDGDDDWYTVAIEEDGTNLEASVRFDTDADVDVFIFDAGGNLVGEGVEPDANPERATAGYLAAGTYLVRVNQFAGPVDFHTGYSLSFDTESATCTTEGGECLSLDPLRIVCNDELGACEFLQGDGAVALGDVCDSSDDCVDEAHFCWAFGSAVEGRNICTIQCADAEDCADVPGTTCTIFGRGFGACLPE